MGSTSPCPELLASPASMLSSAGEAEERDLLLKVSAENFDNCPHTVRSHSTSDESGYSLSLDLVSISDSTQSACLWNHTSRLYEQKIFPDENAPDRCIKQCPDPWSAVDQSKRKSCSEIGCGFSDDHRDPGSACSSMCSSASTVASSTFTSELPASFPTASSAQPLLQQHFIQQPAHRPELHCPWSTPATAAAAAAVAATLFPFSIRPLPPRAAAAAAADGRDYMRLFQAASGPAAAAGPPRRRPAPPPIPQFHAHPADCPAGRAAGDADAEAAEAAAAFIAVAAAERAASERGAGRRRPAAEAFAADAATPAAEPVEEFSLGPGRPFSLLSPVAAAAAAAAAASAYTKQSRRRY